METVLEVIKCNKLDESFEKELGGIKSFTFISKDIIDNNNLVVLMYNNSDIIPMYEALGIYKYLVENNDVTVEIANIMYKYLNQLLVLLTKNLSKESSEDYKSCIRSLQLILIHLSPFINTYMSSEIGQYVIKFMNKHTQEYRSELQVILQNNYGELLDYIDIPNLLEIPGLFNIVKILNGGVDNSIRDLFMKIIETQLDSLTFIKNDRYPFSSNEMLKFLDDYKINLLSLKTIILK